MSLIKIVIADDHILFREGLKRIISLEKDILVVGDASDCAQAVEVTARMRPDVLLMDLKMPSGDAVDALIKIAEKSPVTQVIILTAYSEEESVISTARQRARGYLLKGISAPTLIGAIRKVNAGEIWIDPELQAGIDFERIAKSFTALGPPANETVHGLTKRELEVLKLVAEGMSNEEIGQKIFISGKTVKTHLTNIFDKLQVNNRLKAALCVMPNLKKSDPQT